MYFLYLKSWVWQGVHVYQCYRRTRVHVVFSPSFSLQPAVIKTLHYLHKIIQLHSRLQTTFSEYHKHSRTFQLERVGM